MRGAKLHNSWDTKSQSNRKIGSDVSQYTAMIAEISTERLDYKFLKTSLRRNVNPTCGGRRQYTEPSWCKRAISTSSQDTKQSFEVLPTIIAWLTTCTRFVN